MAPRRIIPGFDAGTKPSRNLLHHLNVLLKDPIYNHLYITHRPSTGIIMLCYYTNVCNEGNCQ